MNYQFHYSKLIEKAQNRPIPTCYTEKHHIIPKSLGGSNKNENLVILTGREHFIAHLLLAKIYGGKMIVAAFLMAFNKQKGIKTSSRQYAWLRQKYSEETSARQIGKLSYMYGRHLSDDTKRKISKFNKGKIVSSETRKKISIAQQNRIFSDETKQRMSEGAKNRSFESRSGENNPMYGKTLSEEHKEKLRKASTGFRHSEETKQKLREREFSEEHRRKISASLTGKKKPPMTEEQKKHYREIRARNRALRKLHKEQETNK